MACSACGDADVITNTAPFRHVRCQPSDWNRLRREAARFATSAALHYSDAEYSILLTNKRLNLVVTIWPGSGEINAMAIARSTPTRSEASLADRFITDLRVKSEPIPV